MRNEIKKAMEVLKDKVCSINVQSGSAINEMSFVGATVDYDEKCETINIATQFVYLGLNVDKCIEVNVDGDVIFTPEDIIEVYLQFDDGLEVEIRSSYAKGVSENTDDIPTTSNKEDIIEKILTKYGAYGIDRDIVEKIYDLAIQMDVPKEIIYPGMKMFLNNAIGIDDVDIVKEVGEGFAEYAVNDTRKENPTVTDRIIAKNFEEEIENNFDWKSLSSNKRINDAIKKATEKFILDNK